MKILKNYAPTLYSLFVELNQLDYSKMSNEQKLKYKILLFAMSELFAYDPTLIRTMRIVKDVELDNIEQKSTLIIKSLIGFVIQYVKKPLIGPVIAIIIDSLFSDTPDVIHNNVCEIMQTDLFNSIELKTILIPVLEHSYFLIQTEIDIMKEGDLK